MQSSDSQIIVQTQYEIPLDYVSVVAAMGIVVVAMQFLFFKRGFEYQEQMGQRGDVVISPSFHFLLVWTEDQVRQRFLLLRKLA
jgi:hypothetical protein